MSTVRIAGTEYPLVGLEELSVGELALLVSARREAEAVARGRVRRRRRMFRLLGRVVAILLPGLPESVLREVPLEGRRMILDHWSETVRG